MYNVEWDEKVTFSRQKRVA